MMPAMNIKNVSLYYTERVPMPAASLSPGRSQMRTGMSPESTNPDGSAYASDENKNSVSRRNFDSYECEACKNRKYQDGSNDPGVSFKTPTRLSPESVAAAVRSHENEHVSHAKTQARQEDKKIVSQSVTYHTAVCPECGRNYISGGTTRTVFRNNTEEQSMEPEKGKYIDLLV